MLTKAEQDNIYWPQFVELICQDTKFLDYFPPHAFVEAPLENSQVKSILAQTYKLAYKSLKPIMVASYHKRLASKYANFKYNKKHNRSTFTVNDITISRLSKLLSLHGLDNYNELIEYLTQPDYASQNLLKEFSNEQVGSGLSMEAAFRIFMKKIHAEQQALLKTVIKDVYIQAWKASKQAKLTKQNASANTKKMELGLNQYLAQLLVEK